MRKRKSRLTGFTLIELLVVVVIIGILASVVALNVTNAPDRVFPTVVKHDFKRIADGIKMFRLDTHRYPENIEELIFGDDVEGWQGPYLDEPPLDPWKRPYIYEYTGDSPKPYELKTLGADGKAGGENLDKDYSSLDAFRDYAAK